MKDVGGLFFRLPTKEKMKKITNKDRIIALILIICIIVPSVFLIFLFSPNKREIKVPGNVALTVDGTKLTIGFYNYFYTSSSSPEVMVKLENEYPGFDSELPLSAQIYDEKSGKTWAMYIDEIVQEQIRSLVYAYNRGVEAGLTLFDEQQARVDANLASIRAEASKFKISADRYASLVYGDYVGIKTVKSVLEMSYLAQNYYEYFRAGFSLSEDEYKNFYSERKEELVYADYICCKVTFESLYEMTSAIEDYEKLTNLTPDIFINEIEEKVRTGTKQFTSSASVMSECDEDDIVKEWLFADERKSGDKTLIADEENLSAFILMACEDTAIDTGISCSARELTLRIADFESAEACENTKKLIEQRLYGSSNREYDMAVLCDIYMNSAQVQTNSGGLVTNIKNEESAANKWLHEEAVKKGDFKVLQNENSYYILMYIDKKEGWRYAADSISAKEKFKSASENISVEKKSAFKHTCFFAA